MSVRNSILGRRARFFLIAFSVPRVDSVHLQPESHWWVFWVGACRGGVLIASFRLLPDYPNVIWASHRLGAIVSGANPSYTESELGAYRDPSVGCSGN